MVEKDFEEDDPFELVGVQMQVENGEHIEEMARTFIEEFLRMGWSEQMIIGLFQLPFYQGPHAAYRILGEKKISTLLREAKSKVR